MAKSLNLPSALPFPLGDSPRVSIVATLARHTLVDGNGVNLAQSAPMARQSKGLVIFCGNLGSKFDEVLAWAMGFGAVAMAVPAEELYFQWMRQYSSQMDLVIVDGGALRDLWKTAGICEWLRCAVPDVPIVLISDDIPAENFLSKSTFVPCDAVIKADLLHPIMLDTAAQVARAAR